jgi:leucyl-tRNA synthetase
MPVDWYNGGMEHTTLHLLYSRFIYKFLYDIGAVPKECGSEPYKKRTAHGMILGEGGRKMSKSKGNIINPDDYIKEYGADTVRMYEMFMGPFDQAIPWEGKSVIGIERFLNRVWDLGIKCLESQVENRESSEEIGRIINQTIKKVGEDIEGMKFNTAISQLMICLNIFEKEKEISQDVFKKFLIILSPFAPHISEELYQKIKNQKSKVKNTDKKQKNLKSIIEEKWPEYDEKLIKEETFNLVIQINGKTRDVIEVMRGISKAEAKEKALSSSKIIGWTQGKEIKKIIFVKDKLINFVV